METIKTDVANDSKLNGLLPNQKYSNVTAEEIQKDVKIGTDAIDSLTKLYDTLFPPKTPVAPVQTPVQVQTPKAPAPTPYGPPYPPQNTPFLSTTAGKVTVGASVVIGLGILTVIIIKIVKK